MKTPEQLAEEVYSEYHEKEWFMSDGYGSFIEERIAQAIMEALAAERDQSRTALLAIAKAYSYENNCAPLINEELARLSDAKPYEAQL